MGLLKKMFTKTNVLRVISYLLTSVISGIIGWGISYVFPAQNPITKEITCTLNSVVRISADDLNIEGQDSCIYMSTISIKNTGNSAIRNDDFQIPMSIEFADNVIVRAQVNKSSNWYVYDEVLNNAKYEGSILYIDSFMLNADEEFSVAVFTERRPSRIVYHSRIADAQELILENETKPIRVAIKKSQPEYFFWYMLGLVLLCGATLTGVIVYSVKKKL